VRFEYRPVLLLAGLAISAAGWLLLASIGLIMFHKNRITFYGKENRSARN
jgi:hypothetical protein